MRAFARKHDLGTAGIGPDLYHAHLDSMELVTFQSNRRECWNEFVAAAPTGHILQSWEWGELRRVVGWEPVRVALCEHGRILAAAQILIRRLPGRIGRMAYVPKGPVLDYDDPTLLASMLATLRAFAADQGLISLKLEPELTEPSDVPGQLLELGLKSSTPVQMRSSIWVDLAAPEDEILARQKQKTRYNTRLAERKQVLVSEARSDELGEWYRMYEVTARRDGFIIYGQEYYREVIDILGAAGMARLLLARHAGDLLAGIIVFRFGRLAQYMYGASSNEKRNLMAPYLLQWMGMKWAKCQGAVSYDLWGIPDRLEETEDLWGVYRHKRGYGGEIVRYIGAFDIVQSPLRHAALERVGKPLLKRVAQLKIQ